MAPRKQQSENREEAGFATSPTVSKLTENSLTSLNIANCNLDSLKAALPRLLESLDISHNRLVKLPESVLHLQHLKSLKCSHNLLSDTADGSFESYRSLEQLDLSFNHLVDLPAWFSSLRRLKEFNVEGNVIGNIIGNLKRGQWMRKIVLREVGLEEFPQFVTNLKDLLHLDCGNSVTPRSRCTERNLIKEVPLNLCKLGWLKILELSNLDIASLPQEFSKLVHLEHLYLDGNYFNFFPECLMKLPKLKVLDMSHNRIAYLPFKFVQLQNLSELHLAFNLLACLPDDLHLLLRLRHLDLYMNRLAVTELPKLRMLLLPEGRLCGIDLRHNYISWDDMKACLPIKRYTSLQSNVRRRLSRSAPRRDIPRGNCWRNQSQKPHRHQNPYVGANSGPTPPARRIWENYEEQPCTPHPAYGRLNGGAAGVGNCADWSEEDDEFDPRNYFGFRYPNQGPFYDFRNLHLFDLNLGPHTMIPSDIHAKQAAGKAEIFNDLLRFDRKLIERSDGVPGRRLEGLKFVVLDGQFDDV